MKTLKNVECGQTVKVSRLGGEGAVRRRIMDMALPRAQKFMCVRLRRSVTLLK